MGYSQGFKSSLEAIRGTQAMAHAYDQAGLTNEPPANLLGVYLDTWIIETQACATCKEGKKMGSHGL